MNKRGQFYLIAAILIVIGVSSIVAVSNYASTPTTPPAINSLSSDLSVEGPKIIDYGVYSQNNVNKLLNNFTSNDFAPYFLKETDNSNVVFIYGNKTNLYAVQYNLASKGTISATIGGVTTWDTLGVYAQNITVIPSGNFLNVTLLNKTFPFQLQDNELFYFIMVEQKQGETYVKKNN